MGETRGDQNVVDKTSSEMERPMWSALKVMRLLGDFAKQARKATLSLFKPVRRPGTTRLPTKIFVKIDIGKFH